NYFNITHLNPIPFIPFPLSRGDMLTNAAKLVGAEQARRLAADGLLGEAADTKSPASVSHFTTHYRRELVFGRMKKIVADYLQLLYV
ncbi:MAG: hypothetical protein KAX78_03150, partial [Phycisphaerae bacterium]|nr:hypothetical protein [Phycisphaerae bacterium]